MLGSCFATGRGVEPSWPMAVEWYRRAAGLGSVSAQANLGYCYANGAGVAVDDAAADAWYRLAAAAGDATASSMLAQRAEEGRPGAAAYLAEAAAGDVATAAAWRGKAVARSGLGRIVALHHRSSTSYQIR